jgi:exodeoxyribonuclease-5
MTVWNEGQKKALEEIKNWVSSKDSSMMSLTGYAGCGKTTLLREIKKYIPESVTYCGMTGKAALRLSEAANLQAVTLHSVLYGRPNQYKRFLNFNKVSKPKTKFVILDEASMCSPKIYQDLLSWEKDFNTRFLIIGDEFQLPPVLSPSEEKEFGTEFSIFSHVKGPRLTEVMRSDNDIVKVATELRSTGKISRKSSGAYKYIRSSTPDVQAVSEYMSNQKNTMLITWTNNLRMSINQMIRNKLGFTDIFPYDNEPIVMCLNSPQGVLNGEIHYCKGMKLGPKIADIQTYRFDVGGEYILVSVDGKNQKFDGFAPNIKDWKIYTNSRYKQKLEDPVPISYGFCMTAHKCQGSEWDNVIIALTEKDLYNPHFRKSTTLPGGNTATFAVRFLYTALTRAKHRVSCILGE